MIDQKIILASKSPRRKFLMEQGGFEVEVRSYDVEEIYPEELDPKAVPEYLAKLKIQPALETLAENEIVITADTIVLFENHILGKPKDAAEAKEYIQKMSGTKHDVITGVCIATSQSQKSFSVFSKVLFSEISNEEIQYYIDNFKPYDKAGAYGIQDWIGWTKIKSIEGSYSNIMGLPMNEVYEAISEL